MYGIIEPTDALVTVARAAYPRTRGRLALMGRRSGMSLELSSSNSRTGSQHPL
jgi:hypothetical protein